jgi:dTDP-4-dehydrorhamnose 3,5-epimerase
LNLRETPLQGAFVVELEPREDERGLFARTFDAQAFAAAGARFDLVQASTSFNPRAGTLRGLHYQAAPHEEAKLVRCTGGAVFDAIVDLRRDSETFRAWFGVELSAANRLGLYVPKGFAHGFQTLEDDSEVLYMMDAPYVAEAASGVRWDDPAFGIEWPEAANRTISERDASYPDFAP